MKQQIDHVFYIMSLVMVRNNNSIIVYSTRMSILKEEYLDFEGFRAQVTGVRPFPRVHSHMDGQVARLVEATSAHATRVTLEQGNMAYLWGRYLYL